MTSILLSIPFCLPHTAPIDTSTAIWALELEQSLTPKCSRGPATPQTPMGARQPLLHPLLLDEFYLHRRSIHTIRRRLGLSQSHRRPLTGRPLAPRPPSIL